MKKLFILALVLAFGSVPHVFAQGFVPLTSIPGLTDGVTTDSDSLPQFFNNLYLYLIGFAAMLAVIEIIWGGLLYSTTDSIGNKEEGKEKIRMAIFGLVLVLSPVLVFSIINPSILNLSFNLPPLDLKVTPAPTTVATSSLPEGGTSYHSSNNYNSVSAGQWCVSATFGNGNFGREARFQCWADYESCRSVLTDIKANPTKYEFTVRDSASCIEQDRSLKF